MEVSGGELSAWWQRRLYLRHDHVRLDIRCDDPLEVDNSLPVQNRSRVDYTTRSSSHSGERSSILPRRFTTARLVCHSLNKRLAINGTLFAALASSFFVTSNSTPPCTSWPMTPA